MCVPVICQLRIPRILTEPKMFFYYPVLWELLLIDWLFIYYSLTNLILLYLSTFAGMLADFLFCSAYCLGRWLSWAAVLIDFIIHFENTYNIPETWPKLWWPNCWLSFCRLIWLTPLQLAASSRPDDGQWGTHLQRAHPAPAHRRR